MYNLLKLYVVLVFLTGCGSTNIKVDGSKKTFDKEDIFILAALRSEELKEYGDSSKIFNDLYESSQKKEYLFRSLKSDLLSKDYTKVINRVNELIEDDLDDSEIIRLKVHALIKLNKLGEATSIALSLVERTKAINDYLMVSDIYVKHKKYDTALKYLESAYIQDYNEKLLDRMSIVLYVNLLRKKDAIAQLETHSRVHGCSKLVCQRLISFYSNDNNINGLLDTYLRLYKIDSSKKVAKKIVQIYGYKKEYINMMDFLQTSSSDDELLFQLYVQSKDYQKASALAYSLYKKNSDIKYLGQSAIFEYESCEDKNNKEMQNRVVKKLEDVIKVAREGVYFNYLGYILIDHSINIKKGIEYIDEALKLEPNSIYYLDSLAWGYYKLGDCVKAKKLMDKVENMQGGNNKEVIKHINIINKCMKDNKRK
ncbi:hypothetical protein N9A28_04260 [Sulfurimonas sp.]|nr:hypothetical protein [Sulfurimonas sp.]